MDVSQYLDLFISEAQDHLQDMNRALLSLEENPDDLSAVETFFRAAHTLKGMAAALGYQKTAALSHAMEDQLHALRRKEKRLTPDLANTLFRCLDGLEHLTHGIAAGEGEKEEIAPLQALLQAAQETAAAPARPSAAVGEPVSGAGWEARVEIAPDCILKAARAFLVLKRMAEAAPILRSDPPENELRAGRYEGMFRLWFSSEADPEALRRTAVSVAEVVAVSVDRGSTEKEPHPAAMAKEQMPAAPRGELPGEAAAALATPVTPVVRIKVTLLDQLLEAVADLVINRSHLAQIARKHLLPDLTEAVEIHASVMDRLQETVLALRMTPVIQAFNRFPRMVRDLAREQGKEMRFEMEGTEIELDRTVLDKITDPLVHILRNAVDHGIELPPERQQANKPSTARLILQARRLQDKAVIEIQDDGRGMSPETIAARAIERGLATPEEVAKMDPSSILELICRPGFSTTEQVTGVSGRGVGMGVVKEVLDEIGGSLEINSQAGQGTCFRLVFPLTMAILPALLVRVEGEVYALPLTHIVHTVEPLLNEVHQLHEQPVLRWEDRILPLVWLSDLLGTPRGNEASPLEEAFLSVVIASRGRQQIGLVVSEILGKEDIVLKPLQGSLQQIEGLAGVTIRGEGQVVLVLDVSGLTHRLTQKVGSVQMPGSDTEA